MATKKTGFNKLPTRAKRAAFAAMEADGKLKNKGKTGKRRGVADVARKFGRARRRIAENRARTPEGKRATGPMMFMKDATRRSPLAHKAYYVSTAPDGYKANGFLTDIRRHISKHYPGVIGETTRTFRNNTNVVKYLKKKFVTNTLGKTGKRRY